MNNKKVLIIAAHPDDEILGCGGTIKYFQSEGYTVGVVFFTNGVSSRTKSSKLIKERKNNLTKVKKLFKFNIIKHFDFFDNELDKYTLLSITKKIEKILDQFKPSIVFTHWEHDINIDHRKIYEATLVATRPYPGQIVKEVYSYEILSGSDWNFLNSFNPNFFINIEKFIDIKIKGLIEYKKEIKNEPHTRSLNNIKRLNKIRGSQVGLKYCEAFKLIRKTLY